jgi:hypothetical protein
MSLTGLEHHITINAVLPGVATSGVTKSPGEHGGNIPKPDPQGRLASGI